MPPPPPDEPTPARAGEGGAAGGAQPDEAPGEAGVATPRTTTVDSMAPALPPPPLATPTGAATEKPSQAAQPGSRDIIQPVRVPTSTSALEGADGKEQQIAKQHASDAPVQNGHATGAGSTASGQVRASPSYECERGSSRGAFLQSRMCALTSWWTAHLQASSASNTTVLDDVWSAAAGALPDIAALHSPKAAWRYFSASLCSCPETACVVAPCCADGYVLIAGIPCEGL